MELNKVIIYQVFTRLFGNRCTTCKENGTLAENGCGKMNDFTIETLKLIHSLGVSHIWYTGIIRHASETDYTRYGIPRQTPAVVKGRAGSPYAIVDYYDVDPDLAVDVDNRMQELEDLIERTHQTGMKVIIDFVPNHVAREYHSICKPEGVRDLGENDDTTQHFSVKNNFYYCWGQPLKWEGYSEQPAKATGNDHFDAHPGRDDWYETVKLNYGVDYCDAGGRSEHFDPVPDTWHQMLDVLNYWADKGIDGFRCDMAEMVPVAFWEWAVSSVKERHPDLIFIGEVYQPSAYRQYIHAGFDYLYDKVGMYDCMRDVVTGRRCAADITSQWQATDDIQEHMLYFLENHDEQRIASDFFAGNGRKGFPAHLVSVLLRKNPYMLYAGQEYGERAMDKEGFSGVDGRTTIFDYWTVNTLYRGYFDRRKRTKEEKELFAAYQQVMVLANQEKAVSCGEMYDLMYANPQLADRQFAFLRKDKHELLLIVANFSEQDVSVHVNIPQHAFDFLKLTGRDSVMATDLLTNESWKISLRADAPVVMSIPLLGGRVLKMKV